MKLTITKDNGDTYFEYADVSITRNGMHVLIMAEEDDVILSATVDLDSLVREIELCQDEEQGDL